MGTVRLFGTETSPYVRRVRIVASELGVDVEMIDTKTDEGQAAVRAVTPIWKVPAAEFDRGDGGQIVFDSAVITGRLMQLHGPGPLAPFDPRDIEQRNLLSVIDGALDSLINVFYLRKDGVDAGDVDYVGKQEQRAASACSWLEARVVGNALTNAAALTIADIALGTTVGWMLFRETYPIDRHPALMRCYEAMVNRPSFQGTRPPLA